MSTSRTASRTAASTAARLLGRIGAAGVLVAALGAPRLARADKTSLACIQSAEDGESMRTNGDLLRARELFTRCSAHDCPAVLRRDCTTWLEQIEHDVPSVVLGARDAKGHDVLDATATVDGVRAQARLDGTALELNPGPHVIRVEAPGLPPVELRVVLRAGERNRQLLATLAPPAPAEPPPKPPSPPPPPPPPPPVAPPAKAAGIPLGVYVFSGLGVAGLGAFSYFAVRGNNDLNHLRDTCAPGCAHSQVTSMRTELEVADVALGVGVVSVVIATWIGVRALTQPKTNAAWEIVVEPTNGGGRAGAVVRF